MHIMQAAAVALPSHYQWMLDGVVTGAATGYLGVQYWLVRTTLKMDAKLTRVHLAVCGNPEIKGDQGIAGDVECLKEGHANHEQRLHSLEEGTPRVWQYPTGDRR